MDFSKPGEVTELLAAWKDGSNEALDELIPMVYSGLRQLAREQLGRERRDHTLQPTALAHEVFLRLFGCRNVSWQNRAHFFAVAAQLMRRVLVDHARKHRAEKRGGLAARVTLDEAHASAEPVDVDVIALNESLTRLEEMDSRQCRIVELRYFGGLSIDEVAEVLSLSPLCRRHRAIAFTTEAVAPATVKREWRVAKLWHRRKLEGTVA